MLFSDWLRTRKEKIRLRSMTEIILKPFTTRICLAVTALIIVLTLTVLMLISTAHAEEQKHVKMHVLVAEDSWLKNIWRRSNEK